jgi:DnaJ-domain-containing protein 1
MNLDYSSISPLLLTSRTEGSKILCQFRAPGSQKTVEAQAYLRKSDTVKTQVIDAVKRNVLYEVRNIAYNLVRQALGCGAVGRIGSTAVSSALSGAAANPVTYSAEDKEQAVVEAFKTVAHLFVFDPAGGSWRDAESLSPMEEQLLRHPVEGNFERDLLARMLVQMAAADNDFSGEERDFLLEQLDLSPLQADELSATAHPILAAECEAVDPPVRETIFQLTYALALADNRLNEAEQSQLSRYARLLQLSPEKETKIAAAIKTSFLENALKTNTDWEDLLALGTQLGMTPKEVEQAWVRHRKATLH